MTRAQLSRCSSGTQAAQISIVGQGKCPNVSFTNDKGDVITTTKRTRFLHYCIQMVITAACDMLCLVDCGVHEDGVEGLDEELRKIVKGWDDPKPEIQIHQRRSYIFLRKHSVLIEKLDWLPLFPPDRLDADEVVWRHERRLSDKAIKDPAVTPRMARLLGRRCQNGNGPFRGRCCGVWQCRVACWADQRRTIAPSVPPCSIWRQGSEVGQWRGRGPQHNQILTKL